MSASNQNNPSLEGARSSDKPLSAGQKVAILMVSLGEQTSAELFKRLSDQEIFLVTKAMTELATISTAQVEVVLEEFYQNTATPTPVIRGGPEFARRFLANAIGPEAAQKVVARLPKPEVAPAAVLERADPNQLARIIQEEHPQTVALILANMTQSYAASLLAALPTALRAEAVRRMARLDEISPDVVRKIMDSIGMKLQQGTGETRRETCGGQRSVAQLCNQLDPALGEEILNRIAEEEEELADSIRNMMFVFDDFLRIDGESIKEVVANVDRKVLTVALKGTSEALKDHFLASMSQRGAEMFREDMEATGPVKIRDVDVAQKQIIASARELEKSGVIALTASAGEQYVL